MLQCLLHEAKIVSEKDVTGAISSGKTHLVAQHRAIRFLTKIDQEVRIQRQATFPERQEKARSG